ncbi:unnamed protein product [Plutella xylostella]|uniref:(diamondback moth) hypothetical protein n=1 Tax=Plutella xylostella TaxID=51655 RepID=A0A8S4EFF3_PLUXY|nr:unnamed protein product [Plutella xylostella]
MRRSTWHPAGICFLPEQWPVAFRARTVTAAAPLIRRPSPARPSADLIKRNYKHSPLPRSTDLLLPAFITYITDVISETSCTPHAAVTAPGRSLTSPHNPTSPTTCDQNVKHPPYYDLKAVSKRLIVQAKRQQSSDNISVIVVFLKEPALISAENRPPMDLGLDNALANGPPPFAVDADACKRQLDAVPDPVDNGILHPDNGLIHPDNGILHSDNGFIHSDNGLIHPDNGLIHPDNGLIHGDNGLLHSDNGLIHPDNGLDSDSDSEDDLGPETAVDVDVDDVDADKNRAAAAPTPPAHTREFLLFSL